MQVADEQKDRVTGRYRKILPTGAIQIKWAADAANEERETFVRSILKPAAFNKDVHLGWRFVVSELMHMKDAKTAAMKR